MAVYAFVCKACDFKKDVHRALGETREPICVCGATMVRDRRSEWMSQDVHIPMHMKSKNTTSRGDFLPSTKDYESPEDPTGEKGMKEWKDTHQVKGSRWV